MLSEIGCAIVLSALILSFLLIAVLRIKLLKKSAKERADFTARSSHQICSMTTETSGLSVGLKNIKTGWSHTRCFPWEHPSTQMLLRSKLYTKVRFNILDKPLEGQDPYSPEAYLEIID